MVTRPPLNPDSTTTTQHEGSVGDPDVSLPFPTLGLTPFKRLS
jgi:hypothetical protein